MTRKYGPPEFEKWHEAKVGYGLTNKELAQRFEASETTIKLGIKYVDGLCGKYSCDNSRAGDTYYCSEHQDSSKGSNPIKEAAIAKKQSLGICTYGSCRAIAWGNQPYCKWHYFRAHTGAHIKTDRNKGLSTISADELADLALEVSQENKDVCPLTDVELVAGEPIQNSPSIDEIIPGRGHVEGNIQIISWQANSVKSRFYYKKGVFSIPVDFFERVKNMQMKAEKFLAD